jgi:hypothetical protein
MANFQRFIGDARPTQQAQGGSGLGEALQVAATGIETGLVVRDELAVGRLREDLQELSEQEQGMVLEAETEIGKFYEARRQGRVSDMAFQTQARKLVEERKRRFPRTERRMEALLSQYNISAGGSGGSSVQDPIEQGIREFEKKVGSYVGAGFGFDTATRLVQEDMARKRRSAQIDLDNRVRESRVAASKEQLQMKQTTFDTDASGIVNSVVDNSLFVPFGADSVNTFMAAFNQQYVPMDGVGRKNLKRETLEDLKQAKLQASRTLEKQLGAAGESVTETTRTRMFKELDEEYALLEGMVTARDPDAFANDYLASKKLGAQVKLAGILEKSDNAFAIGAMAGPIENALNSLMTGVKLSAEAADVLENNETALGLLSPGLLASTQEILRLASLSEPSTTYSIASTGSLSSLYPQGNGALDTSLRPHYRSIMGDMRSELEFQADRGTQMQPGELSLSDSIAPGFRRSAVMDRLVTEIEATPALPSITDLKKGMLEAAQSSPLTVKEIISAETEISLKNSKESQEAFIQTIPTRVTNSAAFLSNTAFRWDDTTIDITIPEDGKGYYVQTPMGPNKSSGSRFSARIMRNLVTAEYGGLNVPVTASSFVGMGPSAGIGGGFSGSASMRRVDVPGAKNVDDAVGFLAPTQQLNMLVVGLLHFNTPEEVANIVANRFARPLFDQAKKAGKNMTFRINGKEVVLGG